MEIPGLAVSRVYLIIKRVSVKSPKSKTPSIKYQSAPSPFQSREYPFASRTFSELPNGNINISVRYADRRMYGQLRQVIKSLGCLRRWCQNYRRLSLCQTGQLEEK